MRDSDRSSTNQNLNSIWHNIINLFQAAKDNILKSFADKVTKGELDRAFENLTDRYTELTEKIFLKMGQYMRRNLLSISKDTILPEDKVQHEPENNVEESDIDGKKKKFQVTCQKIISAKYKKAILEGKLKNLKAVKQRQELLLKKARELKKDQEVVERFDAEAEILEKKIQVLAPLMDKLEKSSPPTSVDNCPVKRKFEQEDEAFSKRAKTEEDED